MKISLLANYRLIAQKTGFDIDLPDGSTIRDVITHIVEQIPQLRTSWYAPDGELYDHLNVFVNGIDAQTFPKYLDTPVRNQDSLEFLPPIAGG
jgi:sulfur-carrier protein